MEKLYRPFAVTVCDRKLEVPNWHFQFSDATFSGGQSSSKYGDHQDRDVDLCRARPTGHDGPRFNRGVRRQLERFPSDFMFQLTAIETKNWKSQIVTSNSKALMGLRKRPLAFTEQGVAMLSGVLKSDRAVRVNIEIMRAFVSMRRAVGANKKLAERMEKAEKKLGEHEGHIGTLFEEIEALSNPSTGPRRNIGFSGE